MIDWNDNAKAAVEYFADWLRADYSYIANLDDFYNRLPQTKTVADAVEQEGEKWTHATETTGKKCKLLTKEPDSDGYYAVILSSGNYDIEHSDFIKPIKTTISEAEAWRKVQDGHPAGFIMEKYNVVAK